MNRMEEVAIIRKVAREDGQEYRMEYSMIMTSGLNASEYDILYGIGAYMYETDTPDPEKGDVLESDCIDFVSTSRGEVEAWLNKLADYSVTPQSLCEVVDILITDRENKMTSWGGEKFQKASETAFCKEDVFEEGLIA